MTTSISRGDIFLLENTGKTTGAEIQKTRPCVIIQNDVGNINSKVTIVAFITGYKEDKKPYPTNVFVTARETGLDKNSLVLCNQLRTVDKSLLLKKIGRVPDEKMKFVDMALICSLDLGYR
jgi:mRNA interferase MazF